MTRPFLICFCILAAVLSSCEKELASNNSLIETQLDSIVPTSARIGDTVTLFGHDFSAITHAQIRINNDTAEIIDKTSNQIKFIVSDKFGSGNVNLQSDTNVIEGPRITYRYLAKVTTIAGTGAEGFQDGWASSAAFRCPWGLAFDKNGMLLVADSYNHSLRKIDLAGLREPYVTSTDLRSFGFYNPYNIAVDTTDNTIFITNFNSDIAKIPAPGVAVKYTVPLMTTTGIAVGSDHRIYVSDNFDHKVYSMNQEGGDIKLLTQSIWTPRNIVVDGEGRVYTINSHVMEILSDGTIKHFDQEELLPGWEFVIDADGNFVEADHINNRIQRVDRETGKVTVIAGSGLAEDVDGIGLQASFNGPMSLVFDKQGNLYVSTYNFDTREGNNIRKITFE